MHYSATEFAYGPVYVHRGKQKGRIGELDNDTTHRGRLHGVVQFAPFGIARCDTLIPMEYLQSVDTQSLLKRHEQLFNLLTPYGGKEIQGEQRITALEELCYVSGMLNDRMFSARFTAPPHGAKLFLSHASADKAFVRGLAVDLAELGHQPWLDEWEILGGESIPSKIAEGLDQTDFLILVLSKSAVASHWVEQEWQAKFWSQVKDRKVVVIPLLKDECEIPTLLRARKYIDFRHDYSSPLEELSDSIARHLKRKNPAG